MKFSRIILRNIIKNSLKQQAEEGVQGGGVTKRQLNGCAK